MLNCDNKLDRSATLTEAQIQESIINYVRSAHDCIIVSRPNEGRRSNRNGAKMRRMGLQSGMPDLDLFWELKNVGFMEVKSAKGKLSDAQIKCHDDLAAFGFRVVVVRSLYDAMIVAKEWRIPKRKLFGG